MRSYGSSHWALRDAGIFVALALRFDVSRKLGPRYFVSCFAGYVAGLVTTIVVMNVFKAAQVSVWGTY